MKSISLMKTFILILTAILLVACSKKPSGTYGFTAGEGTRFAFEYKIEISGSKCWYTSMFGGRQKATFSMSGKTMEIHVDGELKGTYEYDADFDTLTDVDNPQRVFE